MSVDRMQEAVSRVSGYLLEREHVDRVLDEHPMLVRAGTNWDEYGFPWEPFRDLAGPLRTHDDAMPVVLVSDDGKTPKPSWGVRKDPVEYLRLDINPRNELVDIVEAWIEAIATMVEPPESESAFFLRNLKLKPSDVSPRVLEFLGLAEANVDPAQTGHPPDLETTDPAPEAPTATPPTPDPSLGADPAASHGAEGEAPTSGGARPEAPTLPLSGTMRAVQSELGEGPVSAWAIARALQSRHGEYAGGRYATVDLRPRAGAVEHPFAEWWSLVSGHYERDRVASSRHQVLDGLLFLLGLTQVDETFRHELEALDRLQGRLIVEADPAALTPGSGLDSAHGVLSSPEAGLEATTDTPLVRLRAGYRTDSPHGEDKLGIQGEVNAMCEVLTDDDVRPPLAVGLFGAWGSGKSFFMEKMRERIELLTASPSARRPRKVVQIRFNAWHYADTSLWASLAVEIFERLADPEPVDEDARAAWLEDHGDRNREKRRGLIENLETYREAQAALQAEKERLGTERTRLVTARDEAATARAKAIQDAAIPDVLAELGKDPELRTRLAEVKKELGITPAVNELGTLASELRTASGHATHVWRLVKHKGWTVTLAALCFALALLSLTLALSGNWDFLSGISTSAGSFLAVVVAAVQQILPAVRRVNGGLEQVQSALERADEARSRVAADRSAKERALQAELENHMQLMQETTRAITELDQRIAGVQSEVQALSVGRSLYDFLADRAAGYKKHQGVVGMLHRDFRLLDAQLRALAREGQRKQENGEAGVATSSTPAPGASVDGSTTPGGGVGKSDEGPPPLPPIDRVVLYVDDLDRCPPKKVLEVLEAVHLLLALELFIVVVGVDPRWLDRSLRHQYKELSTADDIRTDPYLQAMPTEYLEKIFQIAFTLPAMGPDGYARLIESLATGDGRRKGVGGSDQPDESGSGAGTASPSDRSPSTPGATRAQGPLKRRARTRSTLGGDTIPTRGILAVEKGSAAADGDAPALGLRDHEVAFAQKLGDLVDTPRSAKRLMNTYRLVRSTRSVGSLTFLGAEGRPGEFQAVLTLLAITSGFPTLADRVLARLQMGPAADDPVETWADFVAALQPAANGGVPGRYFPADLGEVSPKDEVRVHEETAWRNLASALESCTADNELIALEPYRRWASSVARFSFTVQ